MSGKIQGDELDIAAAEFINTFNRFKKAAKKLMAIIKPVAKTHSKPLITRRVFGLQVVPFHIVFEDIFPS